MAGESPDKVERERSSGETTESGDVVARPENTAEKERDAKAGATPEESEAESAGEPGDTSGDASGDEAAGGSAVSAEGADVGPEDAPEDASAPAEGDGGAESGKSGPEAEDGREGGVSGDEGDERLKSAVAAWVAREGDKKDEGRTSGRSGESGKSDDGGKVGKGDEGATGGTAESPADEAEGSDSGPSPRDLPVRDSKSGKPDKGAKGDKRGKGDNGDPPTAMFGVVRRDDGDNEDAAERAERLTTAFFGAPKSAAKASAPEEKAGKKPAEGDEAARGNKSVDQPTATFRTKPKEEPKEDKKGRPEGESAEQRSVNENTTVLKLPATDRPKTGPKDTDEPQGEPRDKPAGGPKSGARSGAKADPRAPYRRGEESDAERTSQFVPLKSTDAPRTPAQPKLEPKQGARAEPRKAPAPPQQPPAKPAAKPAAQPQPQPRSQAQPQPQPQPQAQPDEVERTRQQPLPDGGQPATGGQPQPLDLLAQLTNTPPPPETALRTLTRRVKIWTPLALLLVVLFLVAQAVRPLPAAELEMTASKTYGFAGGKPSMPWPSEGQAVVHVDGLGSLGSYGEQKPVPIASVAKVMTAYVILRDHPVKKGTTGAKIPVDQKAEDDAGLSAQNESTVEVKKGQTLTEKEAINAIMIASANNVARLLARWDAGSEKAFVKKMNDAAKELGMKNSTYTDPSGLKAETKSTAADQVKLGKKVMEIPLFREIVKQPQYEDLNGKTQPNWNKLVPLDGVVGIKTGTTTKAGGNLLFAAEKEIGGTRQLIVGAVLGQYKPSILDTVLGESKKLIDAGQDALQARKVVKKGDVVGYVDDQLGGRTPVVATRDVTAVGWSGLKVKLGLTDSGKSVPHTGDKGDKVGTLTVGAGPGQVKVPVALQEPMTEPGFGSKLTRIL
ncbi:D-alanyl-D-alanine carboxypeptidase [Streptomyces albiaxialis]|uniref:D-alanyl-D-alanine carboxypeptidase n=1 Tax=Streptomyces albiaxialis TaxID=329523 RepID=A0ABP5H0F0_9ACTN